MIAPADRNERRNPSVLLKTGAILGQTALSGR